MSSSYWSRRLVRNAGILAVAAAVYFVVLEATASSTQVMYRLSMATGYASVALIAWAMLIGPWRVRGGRSAPVSTDLRRDAGIWGGLFGVAHVVTGLQVHMAGDFLKYFLHRDTEHAMPIRTDLFGFANWTGLFATLLLLMLLAISNDVSLRALGTQRWKRWQRWTYATAVLIVAHTLAYQLPAKNHTAYVLAFVLVTAVVLALQLDGRRRVRARGADRAAGEAAREPTGSASA
jgi:sulfoxide reductase heme-binding subunit YedZ